MYYISSCPGDFLLEIASVCYSIIIPAVDSRDVEVNFLLWLISTMYKNLMTVKHP